MTEPSERPGFVHRRERRGLIGPFTGRQLLSAAVVIAVTAVALVVVTTPLGGAGGPLPADPQPDPVRDRAGRRERPEARRRAAGADGARRRTASRLRSSISTASRSSSPHLRGKAVWLNFWASWCPPCQFETPVLRDVSDAYADQGLEVIGVSVRESSEDNVRAYAEKYQLDYTIAADVTGAVYDLYRLNGIPTSFFIGPEGRDPRDHQRAGDRGRPRRARWRRSCRRPSRRSPAVPSPPSPAPS